MALRDLKSNLKTLKVDKDRPFGGSSGLPYIKGGLPEDSPAGEYLADLARYSSDGTVRGGLFSVVSSTTDAIRISRFLNDFPKGLLFTSKQIGLQKSNPKIETGTRGEAINTQVYSNSNLLAQIALQGTGEHVPRPGFNTNNLLNDVNKYEKIVSGKSTNENRLVTLYNNKILSTPPTNLPDNLSTLGISNDDNVLFNYDGGPGSSYGDGVTFIPRVVNTTQAPTGQINLSPIIDVNELLGFSNNKDLFNNPFIDLYSTDNTEYQQGYGATAADFIRPEQSPEGYTFGNTMTYSKLLASTPGVLQDFRQQTNASTLSSDYNSPVVKIESRLKLGDPGARIKEQRKYINQVGDGTGQDKINLLPLYTSTGDPIQDNGVRDMIKFCIEVINNDNINSTTPLHFRAYITDISDNIGADWNGVKYMGRGESFYTYQGFTREVSFKLTVAAQSKQEMMPLYQKLNYLASSLMPDYNNDGFMRGNLHKLTVGEWFYRTPGILKSMNISIDNNYPWEIKFDEPETGTQVGNTPRPGNFGENDFQTVVNPTNHKNGNVARGSSNFQNSNSDADMMELPQILSINFTFTPILNNLPRLAKDLNGNFTASPILISNHGDKENFIKRIIN